MRRRHPNQILENTNEAGQEADAAPWLVLFFRPRLAFAFFPSDPGPNLTTGDTNYRAKVEGEITGFYDRLYDQLGSFIGFRITPLLAEKYLPGVLGRLPYVRTDDDGKAFSVFLFGPPLSETRTSVDQSFGGRVYETVSGEFALSLDTFFLGDEERAGLRSATGDWVPASAT
jgi:hypothetical protein